MNRLRLCRTLRDFRRSFLRYRFFCRCGRFRFFRLFCRFRLFDRFRDHRLHRCCFLNRFGFGLCRGRFSCRLRGLCRFG